MFGERKAYDRSFSDRKDRSAYGRGGGRAFGNRIDSKPDREWPSYKRVEQKTPAKDEPVAVNTATISATARGIVDPASKDPYAPKDIPVPPTLAVKADSPELQIVTPKATFTPTAGTTSSGDSDFKSKSLPTVDSVYRKVGSDKSASLSRERKRSRSPVSGTSPSPGNPHRSPARKNVPARGDASLDRRGTSADQRDSSQDRHNFDMKPEVSNKDTGGKDTTSKGVEKKFNARCRLFVANLNNNTTEEEFREMFAPFGETGEVYVNKEKGFGFIRLDYRHSAEQAKHALDKKLIKGRNIQVRFATHASALEIHGLNQFASNEFIEQAMSQFGNVERAVVVCDDRGRSKGYAIVEFEWKKSAQKVLDRFKDELFCLGRLPKPVFAKPLTQVDDEQGIHERELERLPGYVQEREFGPRFISPSSLEYQWAKKWRSLFIEEEDKKAKLEHELREARYKLEMEMEAAMQEREAEKMREDLKRRQDELRRFEEEMLRRREADMRGRDRDMRGNRDLAMHGPPPNRDMRSQELEEIRRQEEMILQQQAELEARRGQLLRNAGLAGMPPVRPDLMHSGLPLAAPPGMGPGIPGMPPPAPGPGLLMPPRGIPPPGHPMSGGPLRPPMPMPGSMPPHPMRHEPPRDRYEKRGRRD